MTAFSPTFRPTPTTAGTLVIGAGQAGLAVSRCLTDLDLDHVVVDRGRIAERWHSERWDSLRLLTPNWMTRLPGFRYDGTDGEGFMTAVEAARFLDRYAASFDAPVLEQTAVLDLSHDGRTFLAATTSGTMRAEQVVIATGWCDRPHVPAPAACLAPEVHQVTPDAYRRPEQLPDGGVLVVGASATGVQLALELVSGGRDVVLSVGSHHRMPRRYRGVDTFWWLDRLGAFDRTVDEVDDVWAARTEPALQIAGRPDHLNLDLPTLQDAGVVLVGRFQSADGNRVDVAGDLEATTAAADQRLARMRERIDELIERDGLAGEVLAPEPIRPVGLDQPTPRSLDLARRGITSVVWATGYRRSYPWLRLPILDGRGEICQRRGVTPVAGAYVLGQRFQHHRNSHFIDGVGRDARYVADHIAARVHGERPSPLRGR